MSRTFAGYRPATPEPPQPEQRRSTQCVADGCALPGVFSPQMRGTGTFFCRAHDGIPADHWPLVTERVRKHEKALFAAIDLTNAVARSEPEDRFVHAFVKHFGEAYARRGKHYGMPGQTVKVRGTQPETARDYGQRVQLMLLDMVRADISREAPINLKEVTEAWKPLAAPV